MKALEVGDLVRAWGTPLAGTTIGIIIQVAQEEYIKSPGRDRPEWFTPYLVRWGDGTSDWMRAEYLEKVSGDE